MASLPGNFAGYIVRLSLLLVLSLIVASVGRGQQYPFIPISVPNAPKGCLFPFQDSRGGLWLAGCETGEEGFYYFDGSRFFPLLKNALPRGVVRGMVEDTDGGIWLASSTGIYRVFQNQAEKIVNGVSLAGILRVAPDVFLATVGKSTNDSFSDADVLRIGRSTSTKGGWKAEAILKSVPQVQFRMDNAGHILYGCAGGYCELSGEEVVHWEPGHAFEVIHHSVATRTSYASGASVVWKDHSNCIWLRSFNDASYQCPGDTQATTLPPEVANRGFPLLFELEDGAIAITSFAKLAVGRPGNFRVITQRDGYPGTGGALLANDGSMWFGSDRLYHFPSHLKMEYWSPQNGLDGNVWSLLRMGDRIFAVSGDSVRVLSEDRKQWKLLMNWGAATHVLRGPGNTLLVSSHVNGVAQIDLNGTVLRRSAPAEITTLAQTADGSFWAAGKEVSKIVLQGNHLNLVPAGVPDAQSWANDLKVDRDGELWGCYDGGLGHKEKTGWQVLSEKNGLLKNECTGFAIDPSGSVWYNYKFDGVTLIQNPKSNQPEFKHFLPGPEIGSSPSHFFDTDSRGWLWRGLAEGVRVADVKQAREGQWFLLNGSDGLPDTDTNQKSFFEDSDGSVWFGINSFVIHLFPPDDLLHPTRAPSVFISSFSWGDGAPHIADTVREIKNGADTTVHVGSLQFDQRNALRFRYRLLPNESSWKDQQDLDIHLGKLPWGNYTMELQARLGAGPWSASSIKTFAVLRPIWLSWPALMGFVVIGGLSVVGARRWQERRKERTEKELPELAEWRLAALSPEVRELEGKWLGSRFEVGRILARGGFATVVEGKDHQQAIRSCAIKIFRQGLGDKDWVERRFHQEVLALQQIDHPNVVRIYGYGTTPVGSPYLVMEFVDGKTLRELLEEGSFDLNQVASYLRQMGSALAEIHAHGVCHRDLKPENLMIRKASARGQELVLIDFSIAIVKDPDETIHGLSRAAGTLYYMAPEQAIGYADASSDIYSLGKIVIEMITGRKLTALLPDASMDLPAKVREFLGKLPYGLNEQTIELLGAALEFDPIRRPKNANDFASAIAQDLESAQKHV